MKTSFGVAVFAAALTLVYTRRLPPFSALKRVYPGRQKDGGLYTDEQILTSVKAQNLTGKLNNTCPLRISIMLNLINFHAIIKVPPELDTSQYLTQTFEVKGTENVSVNMYFMLDNSGLTSHLNQQYGLPLVSNKVDEFIGRTGIMLMNISSGVDTCTALLWDGYGFHQARSFIRHTNLSHIFFWQTPNEPCSIKVSGGEKSGLCFTGDSTVELDTGEKIAMEDLKIGQHVKTANDNGDIFYTQVVTFLDHQPRYKGRYYMILTESGRQITMTESHLIFKKEFQISKAGLHKKRAVYASRIRPGDFVYTQGPGNAVLLADRVVGVALGEGKGAYAPVTSEGTVLINDVLVSCFADLADHDLANSFMAPLRALYSLAPNVLGAGGSYIHGYLKMLFRPAGVKILGRDKFYSGPFEEGPRKP